MYPFARFARLMPNTQSHFNSSNLVMATDKSSSFALELAQKTSGPSNWFRNSSRRRNCVFRKSVSVKMTISMSLGSSLVLIKLPSSQIARTGIDRWSSWLDNALNWSHKSCRWWFVTNVCSIIACRLGCKPDGCSQPLSSNCIGSSLSNC